MTSTNLRDHENRPAKIPEGIFRAERETLSRLGPAGITTRRRRGPVRGGGSGRGWIAGRGALGGEGLGWGEVGGYYGGVARAEGEDQHRNPAAHGVADGATHVLRAGVDVHDDRLRRRGDGVNQRQAWAALSATVSCGQTTSWGSSSARPSALACASPSIRQGWHFRGWRRHAKLQPRRAPQGTRCSSSSSARSRLGPPESIPIIVPIVACCE